MSSLKRPHYIVLGIVTVLFLVLYFGLDTKPRDKKRAEKSRALQMEITGIQNLLTEARQGLNAEEIALVDQVTEEVRNAASKEERVNSYKALSSTWFKLGRKDISGFYAEEVAKRDSTAEAWSIAGTTYSLAVQGSQDEKVIEWSGKRAVSAFEQAISLEPENTDHKINLALTYVENPLSAQPMKGIMMLRDLNTSEPENVKVINQLARLAIRTNQFERAVERLTKALTIEPNNKTSNCLIAQAYNALGNTAEAEKYQANCTNF
jgi:tetratricopeptide (TPR) repeat protein